MSSIINTIIDLKPYDDGAEPGWKDTIVQIGVNSHAEGLTINLPAQMTNQNPKNYGPNIHIERRPKGFAIVVSPGDGETMACIIHMQDDGSMKIVDDSIGSVVLETPATPVEITEEDKQRLEYLRGELNAERISMGELVELQNFAAQGKISPGDVQLLEAAGVPEFRESD